MCLNIARWFRDNGTRTAEQVADEYADFALRIAGFVPNPPPAGRAGGRGLIIRTAEPSTVTSEAIPGVALTLSADRGCPQCATRATRKVTPVACRRRSGRPVLRQRTGEPAR